MLPLTSFDLVILTSLGIDKMIALRENLVVQFSVVSFVIMLVIIAGISVIFSVTFNNLVERMGIHDSAMHADIMIAPTDPASFENIVRSVINLRWVSYITVGGGFVVLYGGLVFIVWGGWRTISRQQRSLVASETRFRSFIENSLDIVTVLDVDGTIRYATLR